MVDGNLNQGNIHVSLNPKSKISREMKKKPRNIKKSMTIKTLTYKYTKTKPRRVL